MRRGQVVGVALCLWALTALPAHAVLLRYSPKVGELSKYKVSLAGRTETSAEGLPEPMRMELTGVMQYSTKAISETADTVRVETEMTGGKFTMKAAGQSQSEPVPKGKVVADMDRRGRMVKLIDSDFGNKSGAQDFLAGGAGQWSDFTNFATFPEGEVKVNDTWSDEVKMPSSENGPEIALTIASKLLVVAPYQGRKCAKIRTSFKGPISFSMGSEDSDGNGGMEATLQGDIIWYYDYENSVYVSGEGSMGMDMKMSMAAPEMPGMQMSTKMLMNVKLALVK